MGILTFTIGTLPFKRPYIYNILMVCNNILFSVLNSDGFPGSLLLIYGNTMFFIGITFWTNVLEVIIDKIASIVFVLFF